jgi:hypothetical protein
MRTFALCLLAALPSIASGQDAIQLDISMRRIGQPAIAVAPRVVVPSGQTANVSVAAWNLEVIPTAQADGTITVSSTFTDMVNPKRPATALLPRVEAASGETKTLLSGHWELSITPRLLLTRRASEGER